MLLWVQKRSVSVYGSVNFYIQINYWQQNIIYVHLYFLKFNMVTQLFQVICLVKSPDQLQGFR